MGAATLPYLPSPLLFPFSLHTVAPAEGVPTEKEKKVDVLNLHTAKVDAVVQCRVHAAREQAAAGRLWLWPHAPQESGGTEAHGL